MPWQRDKSLRDHQTLRFPAVATAYAEVASVEQAREALADIHAESLQVIPLGEGSNLVLVGHQASAFLRYTGESVTVLEDGRDALRVQVEGGLNWHAFVRWSVNAGCVGLENLALIPGAVGAAPIQNIGAYGVEVDRFIDAVHGLYLDSGESFNLSASECAFGYRDSVFKHALRDRVLITAVDFCLPKTGDTNTAYPDLLRYFERPNAPAASPLSVMEAVVSIRRAKLPDPATEPNAGSFFKNPVISKEHFERLRTQHESLPGYPQASGDVKVPAAWLIEASGDKGLEMDGVAMHAGHALVLVNTGEGTGEAALALASRVSSDVYQHFEVALEIEPRVYGHA